MKKLVLTFLVLVLFVPALHARRKKEKAGRVEKMVYTDKKYNFKFTIDKAWKYKVGPNKENYRLTLAQIDYEIPPNYLDAPDFTQIPRIAVYADTTSMDVFAFVDSLKSETYSSKQKKEVVKEFEFLDEKLVEEGTEREKVFTKNRRAITIAGEKAILWEGQVQYVKYVTISASDIGAKRVYGAYGGGLIAVKKDDTVVLFSVTSEWDFFAPVINEAITMIKSLQWVEKEKEKEKEKEDKQ